MAEEQRSSLLAVLDQYSSVFRDSPGRTTEVVHDIDVGDAAPIKKSPYRVHPRQVPIIQGKIEAQMRMNLRHPGENECSSPIVQVPKGDGCQQFCLPLFVFQTCHLLF